MSKKVMTVHMMDRYGKYLFEEEKSRATIDKYMRDLQKFYLFLPKEKRVDKEAMIGFKQHLAESYKISSANSILAAVNHFLSYMGWGECRVKQFKQQRSMFRKREKELTKQEYLRLVKAARNQENERLSLLMQTICSTGIRVSEHQFITVEALKQGYAVVSNKGKTRLVFLTPELLRLLKAYCRANRIMQGCVFITKNGNPLNRSNIWTMMKALCKAAGVDAGKVYPHNLRHLFAFTFYGVEKDLLRLADVLGHSSVETTRIYTVSSGMDQKRMMAGLGLVCP